MDVGGWLRSLGLEQYEAAFRENEINERVLPSLTVEDLKELGVTVLGQTMTHAKMCEQGVSGRDLVLPTA